MQLALPARLVREQVLRYLTLTDIVRLNEALLGQPARDFARELLENYVLEEQLVLTPSNSAWLCKRGISARNVDVGKISCTSETVGLFRSARILNFSADIRASPDFGLHSIFEQCAQLESFHSTYGFKIEHKAIATLVKCCPNIIEFECGELRHESFALIAHNYPNLRKLHLASIGGENWDRSRDMKTFLRNTIDTICESFPLLECLGLTFRITNACITTLAARCKHLHTLEMQNSFITETGITNLVTALPGLISLNFMHESGALSQASIMAIAQHCRGLQELKCNLGDSDDNDTTIAFLAEHCPDLRCLYLIEGPDLTDGALESLAAHCPRLEEISVFACENVTDAGVRALATHCPDLHTIDFLSCPLVTHEGLEFLSTRCRHLQYVGLSDHTSMSDATLLMLAQNCARLRYISAPSGMQNITEKGMRVVREQHGVRFDKYLSYGC